MLQQLRRDADYPAIVRTGERLIESNVHRLHRGAGADSAINRILQHWRILTFRRKAQYFNLVANLDGHPLPGLAIKSLLLILDEKGDAGFLVNDSAGQFYSMTKSALRGELQQAADGLRWNIKRICRCGLLDHQIRLARHEQSEAPQLPQPVEQRGADASDFDYAFDQFLRVGDGQLPRVGGKPFPAYHQFDQKTLGLFLKPHRAHSADDFDELTVLAAADQLLEGNRFCRGHGPLAQHLHGSWDHDRSVFTSAGLAFNFHQLARLQRGPIGHLLEIDTGRLILNKA